MTQSRIIIFTLVIAALIASYAFDFSKDLVNFCLASGLLALEVVEFIKFRMILNSRSIFQIWSTEWIYGIGVTLFLIYSFSDEPMSDWNISATLEIGIFGVLYLVRNRRQVYRIEEGGIRNLCNQRLLDSSTITGIKFDDKILVIDTTKYQNDLVIKSDVLYSPTWDELTSEVLKLNKNAD